jgi:hypothetical protein
MLIGDQPGRLESGGTTRLCRNGLRSGWHDQCSSVRVTLGSPGPRGRIPLAISGDLYRVKGRAHYMRADHRETKALSRAFAAHNVRD